MILPDCFFSWVQVNLFGSCFPLKRNVVWKKCDMKCGVWNQMKIWSSHLLDNFKQLSHEPENFSGDSTGFEPMTSAMPVQCSNQLSYEVTQLRAGQFVGFPVKGMSYERNVIWSAVFEIKWRYDPRTCWTIEQEKAFQSVKQAVTSAPILRYFNSN